MMTIPLTRGYATLISDEDYNLLSMYKWSALQAAGGRVYAVRMEATTDGPRKQRCVLMHRMLTNAPRGMHVDHKNRDTLDNQRENLRVCTPSQNGFNTVKQKGKYTSKYKGVSFSAKAGKWRAHIFDKKRFKHIGYFAEEADAARAYNETALRLQKEFARINVI